MMQPVVIEMHFSRVISVVSFLVNKSIPGGKGVISYDSELRVTEPLYAVPKIRMLLPAPR